MNSEILIKRVYNPRDIACITGMERREIKGLLAGGKMKSFEIPGGHLRVTHEDLGEFLDRAGMPKPACWNDPPAQFRVLSVEDDPDLLEIITELLKEEDRIDVRAETNGFTAGLQIAGWHPDLILLDFLMPGISGFEICTRLREDENSADIPVLAMTSLTSRENKEDIFRCGVSDFLGKPFHSENLFAKVRILLGLDRLSPDPAAS